MECEVDLGTLLTEYRRAKEQAKKTGNPELCRELIEQAHQDASRIVQGWHDPMHTTQTILDMEEFLRLHPDEVALDESDLAELEALPMETRTKLKALLHLPQAA